MGSPASRSSGTSDEVRMKTKWCVIVLCAAAVSCSRGGGAKPGAGDEAKPVAVRDDTLLEGTGIGELRIDQATIEEMQGTYGKSEASTLSTATALDFRRPPLGFWFLKPAEGQDPPRLYAVRTLLYDDCYRGTTSKGIGILDSLEAVLAAYGPSEAEYVGMNEHMHYYGQQGVIFTTQHPKEILPALYAKARTVTGKEPSEGVDSRVVTAIMVVRPFNVLEQAKPAMARQQVISTRPKTDLLVSEW